MLIDMLGVTLFIVSSPNSEKKKKFIPYPRQDWAIHAVMALFAEVLRYQPSEISGICSAHSIDKWDLKKSSSGSFLQQKCPHSSG